MSGALPGSAPIQSAAGPAHCKTLPRTSARFERPRGFGVRRSCGALDGRTCNAMFTLGNTSAAAVMCLTLLFWLGCKPQTPTTAGEWLQDKTAESGLNFTHHTGTNYFMPDQMGSGVAVLDFNNDGRLDLYFVQNAGQDASARNQLFEQQADASFKNVSNDSGVDVTGRGMGAIAGDVNNDGLADLVVTEYGATRLFQNLGGGKFREVTADARLDNPQWAVPASFIDFDRDGRLDLVVGNYLDYDPTMECHDIQGRRDFCAPY